MKKNTRPEILAFFQVRCTYRGSVETLNTPWIASRSASQRLSETRWSEKDPCLQCRRTALQGMRDQYELRVMATLAASEARSHVGEPLALSRRVRNIRPSRVSFGLNSSENDHAFQTYRDCRAKKFKLADFRKYNPP